MNGEPFTKVVILDIIVLLVRAWGHSCLFTRGFVVGEVGWWGDSEASEVTNQEVSTGQSACTAKGHLSAWSKSSREILD